MFSVFDVPNEFEGGIRIHFNFFLLGLGTTISHGHPRWGLLIRAAAKAVARGNCFWGEFLVGSVWKCRRKDRNFGHRRSPMPEAKEWYSQLLATHAANCERGESVFGVFSSSATSSHAPMNRSRIKRAFSLGAAGCKEIWHRGESLIFRSIFP